MKTTLTRVTLVIAAAAVLIPRPSSANTELWIGNPGVSVSTNWSDNANWSNLTGGGTPGYPNNDLLFGDTGAAGSVGVINSVVDTSGQSLSMTFTNQSHSPSLKFHNILIPAGVGLTNSNTLLVGVNNTLNGYLTTVSVAGGGVLVQKGANLTVKNISSTLSSGALATLDLSGLSNFVYSVSGGTLTIASAPTGSEARGGGVLNLAAVTNQISVGTIAVALGTGNGGSTANALNLGAGTNVINVGTVNVAAGKVNTAKITFLGSSGGLRLRGAGGADTDRANFTLGSRGSTGTGTLLGSLLFDGHRVDIKAGTMTVGQSTANQSGQPTSGVIQFDTGTIDATTINMAICSGNAGALANGTVTVGSTGSLVVSNISLVNQTLGTSTGNLNVNGGTVTVNGGIYKTTSAGTGNISVTGGTIAMAPGTAIGSVATPIDNLNLNNSVLTLAASGVSASAVANTVNLNGTSDTINVSSVPGLGQFQLIVYTTLNGVYDFNLGTLPSGYQGYLSNNVGSLSVDLVITNVLLKSDTWRGNFGGNWDTSTLNWLSSGNPASYLQGDLVTFDDTLTGTPNVTLTTALSPGSLTVDNSAVNYVFSGSGKLSGFVGLNKSGTSSLTLSETGGDDFTGGIIVSGGTLVLNNTNSAIAGGLVVNGGATAQIGNNSGSGTLPGGAVTIDGSLVFSRTTDLTVSTAISGVGELVKNASGKVTLSNTNGYTGNTTVNAGTLALSGAGSISNSAQITVTSGTLDVSGVTGSSLLNTLNLNSATLTVAVPYLQTPLNASTLNMGGAGNTINVASLPPIASYPVTLRIVQTPTTISGFNATLGTLPSATPAYAGSVALSGDQTAIELTLTAGPVAPRPYVTWSGADSPDMTWSERLNWQLPGAPTTGDNVVFTAAATVGDAVTVNNSLDANFSVATLTYSNSVNGQWHVTEIPTGNSLTVAGALTVGGLTGTGTPLLASQVAMSGGGRLVVTGPSLNVGNGGTAGGLNNNSALNLSALSNFVYSAAAGTVNVGNLNRSTASLVLSAGSNHVTAATINLNTGSSSTTGNSQTLRLGGDTNVVNANTINVGANRTSGSIDFVTTTGSLRLRGAGGADANRANVVLGLRNTGASAGGTTTGTLSFNGHAVDAKIGTLTVGQMTRAGTEANLNGNGVVQFDQGSIDATTINMAICSGNSPTAGANGTVTVGAAAVLTVGNISLANMTSPGAGANATGNLNISGGMVDCAGNIVKTTATGSVGNVSVTGGTLKVGGTAGTVASPIDSLTLDSATLRLNVNGNPIASCIVATTVSASGTTTIDIGSVTNAATATVYPLISYTGTDPFSALSLGSLPAGYSGTLVDDTANSVVGITFSAVPLPPPNISDVLFSGGNVIFGGTGGPASSDYYVIATTNLSLPRASWTRIATNSFDLSGNFSTSVPVDSTKPSRFFSIQVP